MLINSLQVPGPQYAFENPRDEQKDCHRDLRHINIIPRPRLPKYVDSYRDLRYRRQCENELTSWLFYLIQKKHYNLVKHICLLSFGGAELGLHFIRGRNCITL